jgi:N-alpha-acetyltransferase 35, NatC auxiliary subunit
MTLLLAMATDEPNDSSRGYWQDTSSQLLFLKDSHNLAKPVSESFSAKIQRRLASTVPPKPMVELSFDDAFEKMTQMCKDCQEAVRIVDCGPENIQRLKVCVCHGLA